MRGLNLGCGERFHPEWTNLDAAPASPSVQAHDLSKGIPFPDATFDAVYLSHVLEHFEKNKALLLLRECHRVLRREGIVRVVVPDLERIAELYLQALEKTANGANGAELQYDWILLELYDQTVREHPGGEMLEFVGRARTPEQEFIRQRMGGELDRMLASEVAIAGAGHRNPSSIVHRFADAVRRKALRLLIGREGIRAYDLGRFRLSGEIHHWMYDRYSLGRALERAGFSAPRRVGPAESAIPDWIGFHLEMETDGRTYKPDSMYMEASRK